MANVASLRFRPQPGPAQRFWAYHEARPDERALVDADSFAAAAAAFLELAPAQGLEGAVDIVVEDEERGERQAFRIELN